MTSWLLVLEHRGPDLVGIQVFVGRIEQRFGFRLQHAVTNALANETTLPISTVGVESVADDRPAVARDIGDNGDQAQRHLRKIDVRIAD